jgi:hypothetical protein
VLHTELSSSPYERPGHKLRTGCSIVVRPRSAHISPQAAHALVPQATQIFPPQAAHILVPQGAHI